MEVITTLTLDEAHKILLDEMRHWRMHFKITLDKWLMMVGCKAIENETGDGTFASIDDKGEKEFDYCGICDVIANAMKYGKDEKVIFYWDYASDDNEYTLKNIDIPDTLKWARDFAIHQCHEDKDKPFCRETEIPICKLAQSLGREPRSKEKRTIERWLIEGAKPVLTKECGGWFEVELDKTNFPICTLEEAINTLHKANFWDGVSFIYGKNEEHKECTVTKVILPQSLKDALTEKRSSKKPDLPKLKHGEVIIKSGNKLYIDFKTCARYMAFVPDTDDDNRHFEDWIINACLPLIKRICKNADLHEVDWQPFDDVDKFIRKAEAMGILLATKRFPKNSKIVIEYECTPNGIDIHAPKLLTENGKELPDLDLYTEPLAYLPKDRWVQVTKHERLLGSNDIIEGFWVIKNSNEATYSQWLMMAAGAIMQINMGGADVMTNWTEHEAPITWHEALERLLNDCDYTYRFKVTYSMEHMLEDIGANSYKQLNIYSCEPIKD